MDTNYKEIVFKKKIINFKKRHLKLHNYEMLLDKLNINLVKTKKNSPKYNHILNDILNLAEVFDRLGNEAEAQNLK